MKSSSEWSKAAKLLHHFFIIILLYCSIVLFAEKPFSEVFIKVDLI